jgi:uncharacterized protein YciI
MSESKQAFIEKRIVSNEIIPDRLFACFAKVSPDAATALSRTYETGEKIPDTLADLHRRHIKYNHELGEDDLIWEAGPSADTSRILHIYVDSDMESAQKLMVEDPFFKAGIFNSPWWMEWSVHTPYWKVGEPMREIIEGLAMGNGAIAACPPGAEASVSVINVENVTPRKLIVSLCRADASRIKQIEENDRAGKPIPSFLVQHAFNRLGPGGTTAMGYDWESGPSADSLYDLTVFSVGSIEMARLLRENDPFTQHGLFYEPDYFEWYIHTPFRKASPARREILRQLLGQAGVKI